MPAVPYTYFERFCESLVRSFSFIRKSGSFINPFVFSLSVSRCITFGAAKGFITSTGRERYFVNKAKLLHRYN